MNQFVQWLNKPESNDKIVVTNLTYIAFTLGVVITFTVFVYLSA